MATVQIRLSSGVWEYDDQEPLGKAGGFGEVFRGVGEGFDVAVKRLKLNAEQAAHRELGIARKLQERSLEYVVPCIEASQDADSNRYYLVMPICEYSLQDMLDEHQGVLDADTINNVVNSIIRGLLEVGDLVHRDLKPANILFHEGKWKIADFGIAKFVEDSTSLETLRGSLTPAYAAPEQWKNERPTSATDVYALGCIIHTLYTGRPPFTGEDIREKHLSEPPETLDCSPKIAAFVSHMLRKPPGARPTLERCARVLAEIARDSNPSDGIFSGLDDASVEVAKKQMHEEAERLQRETEREQRQMLFDDGVNDLQKIRKRFFNGVASQSEDAKVISPEKMIFGMGEIRIIDVQQNLKERFAGVPNDDHEVDILGLSEISVNCKQTSFGMYKWSAALLLMDLNNGDGLRWYEVAFWETMGRKRHEYAPFSLVDDLNEIRRAMGNGLHIYSVAYGPSPIDGENEDAFVKRWVGLLSQAAVGKLQRPTGMPIRSFVQE